MTPDLDAFAPSERRIIKCLPTPAKIQKFLNSLNYNHERQGETLRSFRSALRHGSAHCLEAVFVTATILEQHGYPSTVLDLSSIDNLDHVVFLYRHHGLYGTVARSRMSGLHGRPPKYRTIHQLVMSYYESFIDETGRIDGYAVANLNDIPRADWRFSPQNVWKVQQYLTDIRHTRLYTSDTRYHQLRRKYLASHANGK